MLLEKFGIQGVINATGTLTVLGGSTLDREVLDAMGEVSQVYLDMPELHEKIGRYIAALTGVEAAYVAAGGGAALALTVAACMTKGDTVKMAQLPNGPSLVEKNEIIIQKLHRNQYDYIIEIPGAKLVEIGTRHGTSPEELERAISDKTAAITYFAYDPQDGVLPLDSVVRISHKHNIPVIVDSAAELPPSQNISKFTKLGADLVIFSGGKDIGAPNDTGLILGKKSLVEVCKRLGPHSYEKTGDGSKTRVYIGRVMKSSKEDIVAFAVALEKYLNTDHALRVREWDKKAENIVHGLSEASFSSSPPPIHAKKVLSTFGHPRPANFPRVEVEINRDSFTAEVLVERLRKSDPAIYSYSVDGNLYFNPQCLKDGEDDVIVKTLLAILGAKPFLIDKTGEGKLA